MLESADREDALSTDDVLSALQRLVVKLAPIINYLETGGLPGEEKTAKRIALTSVQYTHQDNILYRVEDDGTLKVIPLQECSWKPMRGSLGVMLRCLASCGSTTGGRDVPRYYSVDSWLHRVYHQDCW